MIDKRLIAAILIVFAIIFYKAVAMLIALSILLATLLVVYVKFELPDRAVGRVKHTPESPTELRE